MDNPQVSADNLQAERAAFEAIYPGAHSHWNGEGYTVLMWAHRFDGWLTARRASPATPAQGDELPPLPELPRAPLTHPQLGPLFDRMSMHQYAVRYVDLYREYGAACRSSTGDARDAARLDWLVHSESCSFLKIEGTDSMGWFIYNLRTHTSGKIYETYRQAIDAARTAPGGAAEGKGAPDA